MSRQNWLDYFDRNKPEWQKLEEEKQHFLWKKLNKICPPGPGKAKIRAKLYSKLQKETK